MREHIERVSSAIAGLADLTRARSTDPAHARLVDPAHVTLVETTDAGSPVTSHGVHAACCPATQRAGTHGACADHGAAEWAVLVRDKRGGVQRRLVGGWR